MRVLHCCRAGMTHASLDSKALFRARALAVGLTAGDVDGIDAMGWATYGSFAFATSHVPGSGTDVQFLTDIVWGVTLKAGLPLENGRLRFHLTERRVTAWGCWRSFPNTGAGKPQRAFGARPGRLRCHGPAGGEIGSQHPHP